MSDFISLTEFEREFQSRDAATGNARSLIMARLVGDTTSLDVEAARRILLHVLFFSGPRTKVNCG